METNEAKKLERATTWGTIKGKLISTFLSPLLTVLVLIIGFTYVTKVIIPNVQKDFNAKMESLVKFDDPAASHDMVLENNGIFGYTAADFEEAIINAAKQKAKLEVYEVSVSDVVKLTDTGLFNWSALTKTQIITFHGTAIYCVDLSTLTSNDLVVDNDNQSVTLYIPHASLNDNLTIPAEDMEIGEVNNGILSWGEIKQSAEDFKAIQQEAEKKMMQTLVRDQAYIQADKYAKLSITDIYGPMVRKIAPTYTFKVEFQSEH